MRYKSIQRCLRSLLRNIQNILRPYSAWKNKDVDFLLRVINFQKYL